MRRILPAVLMLAAVLAAAHYYRTPLRIFAMQSYRMLAPCSVPITYSIGSIDPRFGISTSTLAADAQKASAMWNTAAGKTLFAYAPSGGEVLIELVYDERQATSEKLKAIGLTVSSDAASYDAVKAKYEALLAVFNAEKAAYETRYAAFQKAAAAYEAKVAAANARGGASRDEYERLDREKQGLLNEQADLAAQQERINGRADTVNALVNTLNRLAAVLNANAATYNAAGATLGEEFEEAVYESRAGKETIRVYEFDSKARLVRLLGHEFGHALGIDHVTDPKAVMYRLNHSTDLNLTDADRSALAARCRFPAVQ